jgi:5-methylthioadenosine/S-adenosylhomocysteine deaminase
MASILLKDCSWVVTQDHERKVLQNVSVLCENGRISEVEKLESTKADQVIDGHRKALLPGLINTHTHLSMTLLRGFADDMELHRWLNEKIWPQEAKLNGERCYWGAILGCAEMIMTGTTSFLDMYFHEEDVARAVRKMGLRAFLSPGLLDFLNPERTQKVLKETEDFAASMRSANDSQVRAAIGPHSGYTCSPELLRRSVELSEKYQAPLTIHVAETRKEQADSERERGVRIVDYLDSLGVLTTRTIAAHSVWLTKSEVMKLAERGVKVAHCPVSNLKLADGGVAPVPEMMEAGVTVSLGTDGASSNNSLDMFETMKMAALLHKHSRWDATIVPAQIALDFATIEGAKTLGIDSEVGSIETGKKADLILVDLDSPGTVPIHGASGLISNIVYSTRSLQVSSTIVDGRPLMIDGKFVEDGMHELLREGQRQAELLVAD